MRLRAVVQSTVYFPVFNLWKLSFLGNGAMDFVTLSKMRNPKESFEEVYKMSEDLWREVPVWNFMFNDKYIYCIDYEIPGDVASSSTMNSLLRNIFTYQEVFMIIQNGEVADVGAAYESDRGVHSIQKFSVIKAKPIPRIYSNDHALFSYQFQNAPGVYSQDSLFKVNYGVHIGDDSYLIPNSFKENPINLLYKKDFKIGSLGTCGDLIRELEFTMTVVKTSLGAEEKDFRKMLDTLKHYYYSGQVHLLIFIADIMTLALPLSEEQAMRKEYRVKVNLNFDLMAADIQQQNLEEEGEVNGSSGSDTVE